MMGGMGSGMIFNLFFWILIIAGIFFVIAWVTGKPNKGPESKGESALDILNKRYAKGEISKEEFEEKKRDIS